MWMASANLPPCSRLAREKTSPTEPQLLSFQPPFSAASNAARAPIQLASASLELAAPEEDFTTLPFSSLAALAGVVEDPAPEADEPPQAEAKKRAAALQSAVVDLRKSRDMLRCSVFRTSERLITRLPIPRPQRDPVGPRP